MNKQFTYKGYKCFVKEMGLWLGTSPFHNGYVEIPKGHRLYRVNYMDSSFPDLEVNGGITYNENFLKFNNEELEGWFIGFDTVHSWNTSETQTAEFVGKELLKLVDQLYKYEKTNKIYRLV